MKKDIQFDYLLPFTQYLPQICEHDSGQPGIKLQESQYSNPSLNNGDITMRKQSDT
jgi:hypothetical protein